MNKASTCQNDHVNNAAGHGKKLFNRIPMKCEAATNSHTMLSSVHINDYTFFYRYFSGYCFIIKGASIIYACCLM